VADEALTAGAVARQLGIAVTTLRTWHQRYGLGPSQHVAGQHRRYSSEDMERLQVMRRLTAQGVAPAEAAAWAKRMPTGDSTMPVSPAPAAARGGGGHTIPVGRAGAAARGLARAAIRLDGPALRDLLELSVAGNGVIGTWTDVLVPVLVGVGERYEATRKFIDVEHLVSRAATEVFSAIPRPPTNDPPRVLLAAADEELHTLPLEALAAALAETGIASRLLGARVPPRALADAIARTGPVVVIIWSQLPASGDPAQIEAILTAPHRPLVVAQAGPGWTGVPEGAVHLDSLQAAVEAVTAAVGAR
jgi:MerR family transcriptional regulator, light-induced transcriptional regulator